MYTERTTQLEVERDSVGTVSAIQIGNSVWSPWSRLKGSVRLIKKSALAGVAHWIECWPEDQRGAGSITTQGTCLGCGPGPQ